MSFAKNKTVEAMALQSGHLCTSHSSVSSDLARLPHCILFRLSENGEKSVDDVIFDDESRLNEFSDANFQQINSEVALTTLIDCPQID